MRTKPLALALCALTLTACGSRADFSALTTGNGAVVAGEDGVPTTGTAVAPGTSTSGAGSSVTSGGAGSVVTSSGGSAVSGAVGSSGTTQPGTSTAGRGGSAGSANGHGAALTAPIRLGYIIQGSAGVSALTGSNVGNANSDVAVQTMNALVSYANSHGGVGGRKISATGFKSEATSQESDRLALCKHITEDYKAQVVLDQNQYLSEDGWACFAQHHTDYFGTVTATDRTWLAQEAPYINTTFLSEDRSMRAIVDGGQAAGFFTGGKVGILLADVPTSHRLYDTVLKPALAKVGVSDPQVRYISNDPNNGQSAQTSSAELAFASAGVNRILFFHNILVYLAFTNAAQSQGYHPRYAFSDYQEMTGVAAFYGSPAQNAGAIGVSSMPSSIPDDASHKSTDTTKPYDRKTMTPGQVHCLDIVSKETHKNYYDPNASGDTLATWSWYCDEFFAWWDAARAIGASWTPEQIGTGLATLGRSYESTNQHSTDWSGGVHDAASSYRVGRYNSSCQCFPKITGWLPI